MFDDKLLKLLLTQILVTIDLGSNDIETTNKNKVTNPPTKMRTKPLTRKANKHQ